MIRRILAASLAVSLLTACTSSPDPAPSPEGVDGPATTLRVLAGSELADMAPILEDAAKATGVTVEFEFIGSLEGAERVASGKADGAYDAVWFSSNRYLEMEPEAKSRLGSSERIMSSPVVLGLRTSAATRLGWTNRAVTWSEIATAASRRDFTFAMTDPSASNTGFSTLVAVASALDGSGRALDASAIDRVSGPVNGFFKAHSLNAGSSDWLVDEFVARNGDLDGLFNYEASLVALNRSKALPEQLTIVYPSDGVVTADYPLTVLADAPEAARDAHRRLATWLRGTDVQQRIGATTARRPALPGVPLPEGLPESPVELPFPETQASLKALLTAYNDELRRPSRTVYVLDVSGSMDGDRITALKTALSGLTGVNTSLTGEFCRFRSREDVVLLPFSQTPQAARSFTVDAANAQPSRDAIRGAIDALRVGGDTAVYDSLVAAYASLDAATDKDRFVSIVLMTDGESNQGRDLAAFKDFLKRRGDAAVTTPIFPILFGEAAEQEMKEIAAATRGQTWDARNGDLTRAFCQIRGYQ
ncbi:Ca-activated chloride channel family protein [Catenuloplanes nepalensis]|uniref:Ca-activated chloride channel family protein n=1 Tax=Catenuloplanes nepalensis TaxID=587533 RepID=A0ABT9MLG7_9ACTN|nr:VWA domain-containing protein [Catenuloplanes nepalensis]MDP9792277.1 Ca-activated chloride channel family protein [Catenuloplanes nepalensis]